MSEEETREIKPEDRIVSRASAAGLLSGLGLSFAAAADEGGPAILVAALLLSWSAMTGMKTARDFDRLDSDTKKTTAGPALKWFAGALVAAALTGTHFIEGYEENNPQPDPPAQTAPAMAAPAPHRS